MHKIERPDNYFFPIISHIIRLCPHFVRNTPYGTREISFSSLDNFLHTRLGHIQQAYASKGRRCDVMTSHRRQYDVISTL